MQRDIFSVVFKCNYLFKFRLEFNNIVLREMFGGELERLTGGWGKLQCSLGELNLWCKCDV